MLSFPARLIQGPQSESASASGRAQDNLRSAGIDTYQHLCLTQQYFITLIYINAARSGVLNKEQLLLWSTLLTSSFRSVVSRFMRPESNLTGHYLLLSATWSLKHNHFLEFQEICLYSRSHDIRKASSSNVLKHGIKSSPLKPYWLWNWKKKKLCHYNDQLIY